MYMCVYKHVGLCMCMHARAHAHKHTHLLAEAIFVLRCLLGQRKESSVEHSKNKGLRILESVASRRETATEPQFGKQDEKQKGSVLFCLELLMTLSAGKTQLDSRRLKMRYNDSFYWEKFQYSVTEQQKRERQLQERRNNAL